MTAPMPPRWTEALVQMLLKPDDRESVSGDLLEEYRESIVPAQGRRADRWYVRQALGLLLRASAPWGILAGIALIVRNLFDIYSPVLYREEFVPRSIVLTWTLVAIYLMASSLQACRTRHVRAGVFIAIIASLIAGVVSIAGAGVMLALWHDENTLSLWRHSGGLDEIYAVPVLLVGVATVLGVLGSAFGRLVAIPFGRRPAS
jgi:hypothetical protein